MRKWSFAFLPLILLAGLPAMAGDPPVNVVPVPPKDTTNTYPTPRRQPPAVAPTATPEPIPTPKPTPTPVHRTQSLPTVTRGKIYGEKQRPGVQRVRVYHYGNSGNRYSSGSAHSYTGRHSHTSASYRSHHGKTSSGSRKHRYSRRGA